MLAFLRMSSTRAIRPASSLIVAFPLDTCTAGDSPKKFGTVYSAASKTATAIRMYFQTGKRFTLLDALDGALGQRHLHRCALHDDLGVRRDLQGDVLLADLGDAAD